MKLCFSTLSCPKWNFKEIMTCAKDLGYDGVEIRGIGPTLDIPKCKNFNPENLNETQLYLDKLGIKIPILSSAIEIAKSTDMKNTIAEIIEYIDLASELDVPYVRVLCTNSAYPAGGNLAEAAIIYNEVCEYGRIKGVTPLIETNGILCSSSIMKEFLQKIQSENKGVLWDIHHPYRYNKETINETIENIGDHIKHCHIKDSIVDGNEVKYKMLGMGDIPIRQAVLKLKNLGYTGYLSLEWTKRWNKELEEPAVALFHYINYFKSL